MTSYFEQLFKQMFLERYSQSDNSENTKERPIKVANEYRKILDKHTIISSLLLLVIGVYSTYLSVPISESMLSSFSTVVSRRDSSLSRLLMSNRSSNNFLFSF